jgi:chemotaxis protein histidine kinase CheA
MGSDNFSSTVDLLKGYNVDLYVGEEIIKGKLMGVETDHIILEDENKYVYYYSIDKIQAITKNTKQYKGEDITTEFMKTQSLADLLSSLKNSWVSILCLNKQSFSGVLSIVDSDFVTLINGEDRILIKISHISNILKGYRKEEKQQEESTNQSEVTNSETKNETTDDKYVETQVFEKSNKRESAKKQQEVVSKVDNEAVVTPKASVNQTEIEKKVWAEPSNTSLPITKVNNDITIVKEEKKQNSQSENNQQNVSVKQNSHTESKWTKTEIPQAHQVDVKKHNPEVVIQNIVKHDKEKLSSSSIDKRAQVKQPIRELIKSNPPQKKDVNAKSTEELLNKVKKIKETLDTNPLMKIEKTKKNTVESKKEEKKPKAQEVGASRFTGEPAPRDFDRRSIFSGWPNRNNSQRRI